MNIKERAYQIASVNMRNRCSPAELEDFAEALVAELAKENKPVAFTNSCELEYLDFKRADGGLVTGAMYEELKARLLAWTKTSSSFGLDSIGKDIAAALEAIEQLERQLAERDTELQKYRDAPVICSQYQDLWGNWCLFLDEKHEIFVRNSAAIPIRNLIVKPGE